MAQSLFFEAQAFYANYTDLYFKHHFNFSLKFFNCAEEEAVIHTALPRSFTLTDPECGSGEGFIGLFGFKQEKDDLDVVCAEAPFLDANVTSKVSVTAHSRCSVLVWSYLFHGALETQDHSYSTNWSKILSVPGSTVEVEVKSEKDRFCPQGVLSATGGQTGKQTQTKE